jgi:hypothetical protein
VTFGIARGRTKRIVRCGTELVRCVECVADSNKLHRMYRHGGASKPCIEPPFCAGVRAYAGRQSPRTNFDRSAECVTRFARLINSRCTCKVHRWIEHAKATFVELRPSRIGLMNGLSNAPADSADATHTGDMRAHHDTEGCEQLLGDGSRSYSYSCFACACALEHRT